MSNKVIPTNATDVINDFLSLSWTDKKFVAKMTKKLIEHDLYAEREREHAAKMAHKFTNKELIEVMEKEGWIEWTGHNGETISIDPKSPHYREDLEERLFSQIVANPEGVTTRQQMADHYADYSFSNAMTHYCEV